MACRVRILRLDGGVQRLDRLDRALLELAIRRNELVGALGQLARLLADPPSQHDDDGDHPRQDRAEDEAYHRDQGTPGVRDESVDGPGVGCDGEDGERPPLSPDRDVDRQAAAALGGRRAAGKTRSEDAVRRLVPGLGFRRALVQASRPSRVQIWRRTTSGSPSSALLSCRVASDPTRRRLWTTAVGTTDVRIRLITSRRSSATARDFASRVSTIRERLHQRPG